MRNGSDRNMGMMDFDTSGGDFQNFDFGGMDTSATSPTGMSFPNMPGPMGGQGTGYPRAGPAGSGSEEYPGMQNMMGDMVDFSNLSMGPMTSATAQMGIFTEPTNPMEPMSPTFTVDPAMDGMGQMEGAGDTMMNVGPDFVTTPTVAAPQQQQQPQQPPQPQTHQTQPQTPDPASNPARR